MKGAVCKRIYDKVVAENEELQAKANAYADLVMENNNLKEENETLKWKLHDTTCWDEFEEAHKKLKQENEKLKKKNESLKQFALDVHNFAYGTEWDDKDIVSAMDFDLIVEKMKKDEKDEEWDYFNTDTQRLTAQSECDKLKKENESLKKSNKQKTKIIHKFREQVKGLDKVMLSSAFQSWREVQCATNPQYTIQDEIDFLNGETTNQELINEVFEDLYAGEYEYDMKNKTYTEIEEEEEVQGSKVDMEAFTKLKENGMMPWVKDE